MELEVLEVPDVQLANQEEPANHRSEQADANENPNLVTAEEFAVLLQELSVDGAMRAIISAESDMYYQRAIVRLIPDEEFQYEVANAVFGDKLAGDIGARTCATHPKTDFGDPCCKDLMSDK